MANVPKVWEAGEKLTHTDLNAVFQWLCDQLDLSPDVSAALQAQISDLQVKCENLEMTVAALTDRVDALENP